MKFRLKALMPSWRKILRDEDVVDRLQPSDLGHLRKIFDRCSKAARIGVWECTLPDEKLTWTDVVYELFDLAPGTPLNREDILALYSKEKADELNRLRTEAIANKSGFTFDADVMTAKGNRRWIRITATVECDNDIPVRIFGLKQDITAEMLMLDEIRRRADFDYLTGLANRFQFQRCLDRLFDMNWNKATTALILIDLDGFKSVNDLMGHKTGDACLEEAARRLREITQDAELTARIGGDEFAVVYTGRNAHDVECAAASIVEALAWQVERVVTVSASVGLAFAKGAMSPTALYEEADNAMYRSKSKGGNQYGRPYEPAASSRAPGQIFQRPRA